jgi:High potential iron-sulfur protein
MKPQIKTLSNNRRIFMMQAVVGCAVVGTALQAKAQAMVAETDAQAAALGYKADATKVDKAKQPKYAAGQVCTNCALFQGAANAAAGGCPLFAGKQVAGKGWCNAWAKKG